MDLRKLPNLGTLRTFEAAARLESFSRAAEELFVTHGAISHQIRALEEDLGVPLFTRHGKRITLTPAGRAYAGCVRGALADIAQATHTLRASVQDERRLTLSTMPSFAARWLTPRIGSFIEQHPDIVVELRSSPALVDFTREDIDVALRLGRGPWPGLHSEKLLDETFFAACSPRIQGGVPARPEDLRRYTLLRSKDEPWLPWFEAAGLHGWAEPESGILFEDSAMLLEAALAGHGVALVRRSLAITDVMAGRLMRLFDIDAPCPWDYYFVCPPHLLKTARVQAFRCWITREIAIFNEALANL